MTILLLMIPLSIVLLVGAGVAFFWAVDHDQFDDMDTPALLPLMDNEELPAEEAKTLNNSVPSNHSPPTDLVDYERRD